MIDFIAAARDHQIKPGEFGPWTIKRINHKHKVTKRLLGVDRHTLLYKITPATMHIPPGEIVMDDSRLELARHMPLWLAARGRVILTGLGMGCCLRGLLANPAVDHVTVIEIDRQIMKWIGPEFEGNLRCDLILADALTWPIPAGARWSIAWHDIHDDGYQLQQLHAQLFLKFFKHADQQGAWSFPRPMKRVIAERSFPLVGGQTRRIRSAATRMPMEGDDR